MKIILMSGGIGQRLWPLSSKKKPKQFLNLLDDDDGSTESMLQRIWRQLQEAKLVENTYIITCNDQLDLIKDQINLNDRVIVEPERRDTFPSVALTVTYLYSNEKLTYDEVVCFLPVDHLVGMEFYKEILNLETIINQTACNIALLGVKPHYDSNKYGYILPMRYSSDGTYKTVEGFIEKPSSNIAKRLINEGALWNCGVFAFKLGYLLEFLESKNYPTNYESLYKEYASLPHTSFDYEVVEKTSNVVVQPYEYFWKDLGNWNSLTQEIKQTIIGTGIISSDSVNTHIINNLNIPVVALGLSDIIVAATSEGILVSSKEPKLNLKDIISTTPF